MQERSREHGEQRAVGILKLMGEMKPDAKTLLYPSHQHLFLMDPGTELDLGSFGGK